MDFVTTLMELVGLALVVVGVYLLLPPAALIVAGVGLIWISRQVTRDDSV